MLDTGTSSSEGATAGSSSSPVPTRPVPATGTGLGWVFTAFFGVFGWAVGIAKLSDNSFFWHLKTGGYILDHGIPHHDVFSYTAPGTHWVAQSWLAEVAYGVLFPFGAMAHPADNPMGVEWFGLAMGLGFVLSFGYWCTDFLVMQRAMAAKDMGAARRTPLLAAVPKMFFPFLVIFPGLISLACSIVFSVIFTPPSMRAISATRASPVRGTTDVIVRPSTTFFSTRKWLSA